MKKTNSKPIDFVIMWVDGNDPDWLRKKQKYQKENRDGDARDSRYRDWDLLKYLFRGIEQYAKFVNKIYLVTDNQKPSWLNVHNKKIEIVDHKDFIPKQFLPTFNANTIEINLHRIKSLSDNFVLFNDDTFIINQTDENDFYINDAPCDSAILNPIISHEEDPFFKMVLNDVVVINKHFDKNEVIKKYKTKWFNLKYGKALIRNILLIPWKHFVGFYDFHLPNSFKKQVFNELWSLENDLLTNTSLCKFRDSNTNVNQWLFRYWQLVSGNFVPRNTEFGNYYTLPIPKDKLKEILFDNKRKVICLNDIDGDYDFEEEKQKVIKVFEEKFSNKSSFEI